MLAACIALALQAAAPLVPLDPVDPLDPEAERASFRLAPGFVVELVLCEPAAPKVVDIAFDEAGRLWAVTASEYPLDGNEDERAAELYRRGGRDQVLVIERPWEGERLVPRVFADGLAMPMSVLPMGSSAIVQHGSEILRLPDDDGDGRADRREVLLSGFGIQDSHLMPHRFLRAPDGWIYTAQGAFNLSLVLDRGGRRTRFDHCKLARFTDDGERFEVIGVGLNNVWGIVFDERGELLIQEANDLGFGIAPFVIGASYAGIGQQRFRPYAPMQPPATELRFGGTGLSGLAHTTSAGALPAPYEGAFFLANPIERKVQAVRRSGAGPSSRFEALPDLLASSDPRFRPVAIHFGPEDALYVVDWYNPIISHNEVPRSHPDRDRHRTRLWRIRRADAAPFAPPDLRRAEPAELLAGLSSQRQFVARASWRQIVERGLRELAPELERLALGHAPPIAARALALWSLEGLRAVDPPLASALLRDPEPALRRAAVRALAASGATLDDWLALDPDPARDADLEVRCEFFRALASLPDQDPRLVERCLRGAPAPDERESVLCEQDATRALRGASLAAARERMWRRIALEGREAATLALLEGERARRADAAGGAPPLLEAEGRALAALALGDARGANELAHALSELEHARGPSTEELALCARHAHEPRVLAFLAARLARPELARATLEALLDAPLLDPAPALGEALVAALDGLGDPALLVRAAARLELRALAPALVALAEDGERAQALRRDALRALRALGALEVELCAALFDPCLSGDELAREALLALASLPAEQALAPALERLPRAPPIVARAALAELASSPAGALGVVRAALAGDIDEACFDERVLERLRAALDARGASGAEPELGALEELDELLERLGAGGAEVLVLSGGADDYADTDLALAPPFTIEAWVQLEEGIDQRDGLLARPGRFDLNFAGARPRLYLGPEHGDVLIARRTVEPGRWTHVALSASSEGRLRLYLDGELDLERDGEQRPAGWSAEWATASELDVGRTTPGGAALALLELRVWSLERSAREIALGARRALDGERPAGLELRVPGDPLRLRGAARLEKRRDLPALLDEGSARARALRFERFADLLAAGDPERGRAPFERACQVCHTLGGRGESVGPPLDGAGARGVDALLAALLEPSAALESGYRELLVEMRDGTRWSGLLLGSDDATLRLRVAPAAGPSEPRVLRRSEVARTRWSKLSLMPEGLLEALPPEEAGDLLAFLASLR